MNKLRMNLMIVAALLAALSSYAQFSSNDYKRVDNLVDSLSKMIYYRGNNVHSIENSSLFWYTTTTPKGSEYVLVDPCQPIKKAAFNHQKLAEALNNATDTKINANQLPLRDVQFTSLGDTLRFKYQDYHWFYAIAADNLVKEDKIEDRGSRKHWAVARDELGWEAQKSPDGKYEAYIGEFNLWIKDLKTGEKTQLSFDGSPGEFYSSYLKWSPNSKYIAANKFRPAEKRYIQFMESSPKGQIQPKLHKMEYLKPGDALPIRQPVVFSVQDKKKTEIEFGAYLNQFNLTDPDWRDDSRGFTLEYNQRGHQKYSVLEINPETGEVTVLAEENPESFFSYSGKRFRKDLNDGEEMIWMSERDGWNHLYLCDRLGNVKNQITKGEWVVRKVENVDIEKRRILFSASGINQNEDPYHLHYYTIGFDGKDLKELTPEKANHEVVFSHDHKYFIDYYSRADFPGKTILRSVSDGTLILNLEETDIAELKKTNWNMPEVFSAKGRDGKTDIWGLIYRPLNFDPNKKYPVIEYIYAGPHSSFVPKSFLGVYSRFAGLAELGFICVQIDGMGTSNRSKAFHDVCWQNLRDGGFPDRIKWMQVAAEKYPYMDIELVGIFGGSAGGQSSTGAVLFHPDFYDVAVSSCGCHDNRMDKIWWNEQWMGYPIGKHYDESSNVTNAYKLQGNLMLILGEIDDNVDPASTIQLADALIKADKDFELVVLPGVNHTLGGDYGERKRRDFFVKHLLNTETPNWNAE